MNIEEEEKKITRRDFLGKTALWTFSAAMTASLLGLLKFTKSALLPDVSRVFKIGKPGEIPVDSAKIYPDQKVIVIRNSEGVFAISLICTHLGCVVSKIDAGFSCPCHGSIFDNEGKVVAGPAPKNLPWYEVSIHSSGKLIVDADMEVPTGKKLAI